MARPEKRGISYFNIDCDQDDKIEYVIAKHKMEGYGVLVQIWRKIYGIDGHFCLWSEKNIYLFAKDNGVEIAVLNDIVTTCFEEGIFNLEMYQKYSILTGSGVQKRWLKIVRDAKRKDQEIDQKICLLELTPEKLELTPEETQVNPASSTQSKVKKSKVKKSKEEESKEKKREGHSTFVPPTQFEVEDFFKEDHVINVSKWDQKKCKTEAQKFVNKYTSVDWKIGRGQVPMKDWKSSAMNWIESEKKWAEENGTKIVNQTPPVYRSGQTQPSYPSIEPSTEEKRQLAIDVIVSSFDDYSRSGHYDDFANTVYRAFTVSLSNITFIKFIENRDEYFISKAKERTIVRSGSELDMKSALLRTIEANTLSGSKADEKLLVEARKEAVREFYAYLVKENIPVTKIID